MESITGKIVAITGASSGIGEATARRLAREGANVLLGARRTERLMQIVAAIRAEGGDALAVELDVSSRQSFSDFIDAGIAYFGGLDVLVNNAGVMPMSYLAEGKVEEWEQMIDVNFRGVLYGVAKVLPLFTASNSGHFVNVTSVADRVVTPASSVYSATKFAVRAFSEGLRQEVGDKIRVTLIVPGATATELTQTITNPAIKQAFEDRFFQSAMSPDVIAQAISYALRQPPHVDVSELVVRTTDSPV